MVVNMKFEAQKSANIAYLEKKDNNKPFRPINKWNSSFLVAYGLTIASNCSFGFVSLAPARWIIQS
jgi:hypothetical protein